MKFVCMCENEERKVSLYSLRRLWLSFEEKERSSSSIPTLVASRHRLGLGGEWFFYHMLLIISTIANDIQ